MSELLLPLLTSLSTALAGGIIGGIISSRQQRLRFNHELQLLRQEHKTEFMAEHTARYFLSHQSYTDRSFDTLRDAIGGFEDNELRQILVRAGAIRTFRRDGSEWWRLLDRQEEFIKKARSKVENDVS